MKYLCTSRLGTLPSVASTLKEVPLFPLIHPDSVMLCIRLLPPLYCEHYEGRD
jgi:hypothetical protein